MKKLALVTLVGVLLAAAPASARNMKGKFGVGFDQTLAGVSGLSVTYWMTPYLGTDVTLGLGVASYSPDAGANDYTPFELAFSVGMRYNIARSQLANLGIGIRFSGSYLNEDANPTPDQTGKSQGTFHPAIEIPFTFEFFFSDHFAIRMAAGIVFDLVPTTGRALTPVGKFINDSSTSGAAAGTGTAAKPGRSDNDELGFGFGLGNGGLFGSAGFCFYF